MEMSNEAVKALKCALEGNNVLFVSKRGRDSDLNFYRSCDFVDKHFHNYTANRRNGTIYFEKGRITFMSFGEAYIGCRGRRCKVFLDEYLQKDLATFDSIRACEVGYVEK